MSYRDLIAPLYADDPVRLNLITTPRSTAVAFAKLDKKKEDKKVNFEAFHKKTNTKFAGNVQNNRAVRLVTMNEHQKAKRDQNLMAKRGITTSTSSSSSNSSIKLLTSSTSYAALTGSELHPSDKSGEVEADKSGDRRREQLRNWKEQKAVLQNNSKTITKPVFKNGAVVAPAQVKVKLPPPPQAYKSKIFPAPSNPPQPAFIKKVPPPAHKVMLPVERRVTRAMTKGTATERPNSKQVASASTSSTVAKMKNLEINGKKEGKSKSPVPTSVAPVPIPAAPVLVAPPKKLKPQAIDSVYVQNNATFIEACSKLGNYSQKWREILETQDISEVNIKDDIISVLGSVKLLLDSKLPQFAQLLYSYICKEMDPGPILECDLQGWWDVAVIQVNSVYDRFEELQKLKDNNWIQQEEAPLPQIQKTSVALKTTPKKAIKKVAASKGVRDFLAMKRNNARNVLENMEQDVKASSTKTTGLDSFTGKFESQAMLTPRLENKRLSKILTPRRTPRRLSTTWTLAASSLRKSMGPIYAPGSREATPKD